MSRDDFYTPTDTDALRMENELLAFEIRFLKAQLSGREAERKRAVAQLERRLEDTRRRLEEFKQQLEESKRSAAQLESRLAEAERAEQDIALLLRLMASSPFGWYFGLKQDFRVLHQRYLDGDA